MSIVFTDAQLRTASKDVLASTSIVDLLEQQSNNTSDVRQDAYNKDKNNKIFFDNYMNIIKRYNEERIAIAGNTITEYNENTLIQSAKQASGNAHFPMSPVWVNFPPKLLAENNGNPTSVQPISEIIPIPIANNFIDELKNGWADGSDSVTTDIGYTTGFPLTYTGSGSFSIGQRVVVIGGGNSLLGTVNAIGASSVTITELQAPLAPPPPGSILRNYHTGYSNNEREHTAPTTSPEVLSYYEDNVIDQLNIWASYLEPQYTALSLNDATGVDAIEISTAKLQVSSALSVYDTYSAAPYTGAGVARFGDNIINQVSASLALRSTECPARDIQINSRLGSLTQNSEGATSGSGQFYNLWKWIDLRCSRSSGSLLKYYSLDIGVTFINSAQTSAENKVEEYSTVMLVFRLTFDPNGTNIVTLPDVTGLSVSDTVTILDDIVENGVFNTTIISIDGNDVTTSSFISNLTVNNVARLIKRL